MWLFEINKFDTCSTTSAQPCRFALCDDWPLLQEGFVFVNDLQAQVDWEQAVGKFLLHVTLHQG